MELDNYRNFLAIVETGSMTAAAECVHIAQPALSKQLRGLEDFFGAKLLITNRGSRRVILTEAGSLLYQKAKYICSLEDLARDEISTSLRGAVGTLRLSVANSRSAPFIRNTLKAFNELYPDVAYVVYEASFAEQREQLLSGITEIGILSTPIDQRGDFEELFRRDECLAAIYLNNSRWLENPRRKGMYLEELGSTPVCVSIGCSEIFKRCCDKIGFTPHILSVNTTRHTALQWARADAGVAVVPIEWGEEISPQFKIKKLLDADVELYKSVVKVSGRPLSPLAMRFVEFYNENSNSHRLCNIKALRKESGI